MAYEPIIESFEDEHDIDVDDNDNDNDSNVVVDIDHERRRRPTYNFSIWSTSTSNTRRSNTKEYQNRKWKLIASFWFLGLLNNSSYVIMIACAKNISEGGTGLVFLANVVPGLVMKASAPYWFHAVPYETRLSVATLSMALSFLLVAVASNDNSTKHNNNNDNNTTTTLITTYKLLFQLLGVAFGSAQTGLGEASLLALAGKTDGAAAAAATATSRSPSSNNKNNNKGQCLTSFSSGTGMAGVFGFFWKWWWNDFWGFSLSTTLYLALALAVGYLTTFRYAMTHQPPPDQENRNINNEYDDDDDDDDIKYDLKLHTIETELSPITNNNNDKEENTTTSTTSTTTMPPSETLALNVNTATSPSQQQSQVQQQVAVGYDTHDSNSDAIVILEIDEMTGGQRFRLVLSLWPYMIPLFVVYAAEYALQAGTWSAMGFPIDDRESRDRFYEFSNWLYQAGVFLSRSSGTLFTAPIWVLWLMPALQTLNLIVFCFVASHPMTSPLYKPGLLFTGAFYTGLLGGAVYICGYKRICADLPLAHREFALSATSVAEGLGIVVADALGLVIQACLYHINGLEEATLSCPFG